MKLHCVFQVDKSAPNTHNFWEHCDRTALMVYEGYSLCLEHYRNTLAGAAVDGNH